MGAREEPDLLALLADALLERVDALAEERARQHDAQPQAEPVRDDETWLKVCEVAQRVGASTKTVYRALKSGALAGERLGAHWRIRPEAVDAWLATPPGSKAEGAPAQLPVAKPGRRRLRPVGDDFKSRARDRARARRQGGRAR